MSKSNYTLGIVFIIFGVTGILGYFFDYNFFSMSRLWPLFILIPGLGFELAYFAEHKAAGLLVPGGILTTLGLLFLFETYTNWSFSAYTWPVYILAPAVGLFQLYLFGNRNKGLLIPVSILTIVALFSFFGTSYAFISRSLIWPVILIVVGLIILFGKSDNDSNSDNPNSPFSK